MNEIEALAGQVAAARVVADRAFHDMKAAEVRESDASNRLRILTAQLRNAVDRLVEAQEVEP